MERKILAALVAKKLDGTINDFVAEHKATAEKLGIDLEQLTELLWELAGEAVVLRQEHKKSS